MIETPEKATIGCGVPLRRMVTGLWQIEDQERDGKPFDLDAAAVALGSNLDDVVRTRIYLRHEADWEAVSTVHARYFCAVRPANTLIAGVTVIGGNDVEIEAEVEISRPVPAAGD